MLVLTASGDRTARLWDAATGLVLCPPWKNDRAWPSGRSMDLFAPPAGAKCSVRYLVVERSGKNARAWSLAELLFRVDQ
jgi:hypothetical protein